MQSESQEDYLKLIYKLSENNRNHILTGDIASGMGVNAASVIDMLKKLAVAKMIFYKPYQGVRLTVKGRRYAVSLVRRHRLWESFLVQHLGISWNRVHDIAEKLEHVSSDDLTQKLDAFLGYPAFDPHGDPIPDEKGNLPQRIATGLLFLTRGEKISISRVKNDSPLFLEAFDALQLKLGEELRVLEVNAFDGSLTLTKKDKSKVFLSKEMAAQIECITL